MSTPPTPPEGFEFTGEFRLPAVNEWFWSDAINAARQRDTKSVPVDPRIILRKKIRVMVGGAPVTRKWAEEIGADGYGKDAASAVSLVKSLLGTRTP